MKTLVLVFFLSLLSVSGVVGQQTIEKQTYTYKRVGNVEIKLDVYASKTDSPVIVWIHGGGLIFGSRQDIPDEQVKLYVKAGYTIVSIDYRLAPETRLEEIVEDVKDVIEWVRGSGAEKSGINPSKLFVVGHSAGAYLALMTGYVLDTPPDAIVSFYGYGEITGDWYSQPDPFYRTWDLISKEDADQMVGSAILTEGAFDKRFDFYVYCRQNGSWTQTVSGYHPGENPEQLIPYCPLKNVHPNYPPTLLIHGDKDTDVPLDQSKMMLQALKTNQVVNEFILMKGYDHVFDIMEGGLGNDDIRQAFDDVIDFLKKVE